MRRRARRAGDHARRCRRCRWLLGRRGRVPAARRLLRHLPGRVAPRRLDPVLAVAARSWSSGRSDATLNRGGVRLGTAEFYASSRSCPRWPTALWSTSRTRPAGPASCCCSSCSAPGHELDDALVAADPRRAAHGAVPAARAGPDPRRGGRAAHRTGKKLEVPVKRILHGADPETVAQRDALADPAALERSRPWPGHEDRGRRHRRDRRELGAALPRPRPRRHGHRPAPGARTGSRSWVRSGRRSACGSSDDLAAGRRRRRLRAGERPGASGAQARAVRGLDAAARPDVVVASSSSRLRPPTSPAAPPRIPNACSSGTRSTRRTSCRWSRSWPGR